MYISNDFPIGFTEKHRENVRRHRQELRAHVDAARDAAARAQKPSPTDQEIWARLEELEMEEEEKQEIQKFVAWI